MHDGYKQCSIRATSEVKYGKFFTMKVSAKGRYFISINQKSKRKYAKEVQKTFKYSTATLVIARQESDGSYKYIEGQQREDREVWSGESEGATLDLGTYVVYAKVQWRNNSKDEFTLSSYGPDAVTLKEISRVEAKDFLAETYFSHAKTVSKR